ncbi:MAG: thiol reductant ABC exporter subunit CydC [Candidatus Schekmanbacteria bacterium RIFCSPHIGHO2_02_FULL_38_11]|uniref:Thiol reductant ABC exporter subunit CydC n=1 Tax=Candidatus Schekmanbacteria bacterium RIFCSPLOWO2_12_FULL_38_15 TaxID=1817883 RepID=A0A1F7SJK1_9BACT|nr:MAG: thiol reductant ABC exporter subunit CydC [Candidatus Schekmanbacteria bacterium RIFCSPLOWO2_02_FULL_38_14]OGL53377.1 MAG: thiol reductant ABC exporter subunit CydC [Candidatus Schekmanbacteria bacterium RIFCSPLOWO2_12_FULL_38_15]OGL55731.1 MAG: thiol reductant ABC exporter subunit CydC [Candidatus Schekmanbacteria bacterium RIFCSPHIGHO2_02_FULL_38_11]
MDSKNKDVSMSRFHIVIRLFKMVKRVRGIMLFAIFFGILNHLSNIALLTWGAWLVSSFIIPDATPPSTFSIVLLFIFGVTKGVSAYVEQLGNHEVAFRLLAHLRTQFYKQIEPLVPAKLLDKRSGDVISRIGGDIEIIEVFFAHTISPIAIAASVSIAVLIFLGMWWWVLPVVIFPFQFILGVVVPLSWERYVRTTGQTLRATLGETNAYLTDSLQGLETILLFNQGKKRREEINKRGTFLNSLKSSHSSRQGWLLGFVNGMILLANITIIVVAVKGYLGNNLDLQGVITVTAASVSAFVPLFSVAVLSHYLTESFAAAERLFKMIDEKPAVIDSPTCTRELPKRFDISFKNLSFKYNENGGPLVLDNFNLSIPQGKSIALIGESGSGKSTILRLMMRFWDFKDGEILIGEKNIKDICQESIYGMMALVAQDSHLFDTTIKENIALGKPDASMDEIIESAKRASIHDFIMTLPSKYETSIGELGDKLSGGERQRIVISRVLLKNPPILLFDEPTSNLDSFNENAIQETLNNVSKDKTVIIVTHRLSLLANVDKAYRLVDGKLVEVGVGNNAGKTATASC